MILWPQIKLFVLAERVKAWRVRGLEWRRKIGRDRESTSAFTSSTHTKATHNVSSMLKINIYLYILYVFYSLFMYGFAKPQYRPSI